jgi:methanogenic corrinoid protein MtbC1
VALLRALARLVQSGARIGDLASRPVEEVLARAEARDQDGTPLGAILSAVERFDRATIREILAAERERRGLGRLCDEIIQPLAEIVGDRWALGLLPVALEHLASEVVVSFLKHELGAAQDSAGPLLLAACLAGERHEWGILHSLVHAEAKGWRLRYLGADLPLNDAIEAAWRTRPSVLALSASDAANVAGRLEELTLLPGRLPPGVVPMIGGRGFTPHLSALEPAGFVHSGVDFPAPGSLASHAARPR